MSLTLNTPQDLRAWHVPLLRQLTEHRELVYASEHAALFLELQGTVAARLWDLIGVLTPAEVELVDAAVAVLVATLQSPDLARWIEARGSADGPLTRLAELMSQVIEAEQQLAALRKDLPGVDGAGTRAGFPGAVTDAQSKALCSDIEQQSVKARALRQAFRDERARLAAEDPGFAAAFAPLQPQVLRAIAGHAGAGAVLCMLELHQKALPTDVPTAERGRVVAALLHADGRRTQLLELAGVSELAWHAQQYRPEGRGLARRGPLRGAPPVANPASADEAPDIDPAPITDLLAPRMSQALWTPLQQALQDSGVTTGRLHVCLHGTTQQLPLALRQDSDCPGVQVLPWPGVPYLRRAATATDTAAHGPWLVGHDCAWESEQPLPMVAVEAALLCDLLHRRSQPVQPVELAAQLHVQASALVACCHGGADQAVFDHALRLGSKPLTVRQILQDRLGPPLALLPACFAGRTDEDAAGNALGVAAAFMLSGTRVVVASSKALPDRLAPWLSTLAAWHAMQGKPHHEAAQLAREQFSRLAFPEGYRSWLQAALPQALATIQPGGEEAARVRGPLAAHALRDAASNWPWQGETEHLFSSDRQLREQATRSVVEGVLRPFGDGAHARALADAVREMAAFVFVYGVG